MFSDPRKRLRMFTPLAGVLLWTSAAAQVSPTVDLPAVTVTAQDSPTGPAYGFVARRAFSATKTDTLIMDTPQSISVITRERLEALGAQSLRQAVDYTAGVASGGTDNRRDSIFIRGTPATRYLNGLLDSVGYYNNTRVDPYTLERIDIIKGPSAMLYGQGAIGGIFNLVSKRPQAEASREIGVSYGSYRRRQVQADLTGPITEDGQWRYRLVGLARLGDSSVRHVKDDRYIISPSLSYHPSAVTSLTLLSNFQKDVTGSMIGFFPWRGMRTGKLRIATDAFISEPDFDRYQAEQQAVGYEFQHAVNEVFSVRQNLRYQQSKLDYRSIYTAGFRGASHGWVPGSDTLLNRTLYSRQTDLRQLLVDTSSQFKFRTGPFAHTLLLGLDYQRSRLASRRGVGGSARPLDIFNPVYGDYTPPSSYVDNPTERATQSGLYLQEQLEWREWLLLAGLRHDRSRAAASGSRSARQDDREVSKRFGLMYRAASGLHPYVSYSESFQGLTGYNNSNQPFKPLRGDQWEAGLKYQPQDGNLIFTLAVFDMSERNRKVAGVVNGVADQIQVGKVRSKGLELELRASMGQLDLIANYSYVDARVAKGAQAEQGRRMAGVPADSASLWANYRLGALGLPALQLGAGVRYAGARFDELGNNRLPAVTLYDAMLAYDTGEFRAALNATNLFDKRHLNSCIQRGDCFFGAGRSVVASVSYRF